VLSRESTGTSTSDWDEENLLTTVTSSRPLVTSLSTDNLQQELTRATCTSDGLSDKENVVQQMKHHVKYLPDNLSTVSTTSRRSSITCTVTIRVHQVPPLIPQGLLTGHFGVRGSKVKVTVGQR